MSLLLYFLGGLQCYSIIQPAATKRVQSMSPLLYGHSHDDLPGIGRSMDVGVDACGYAPISIDEVMARLISEVEL